MVADAVLVEGEEDVDRGVGGGVSGGAGGF